ncbi:SGNH/GDSL hydrolase family protein [Luteitalea pratensis]|nr:SGNH/GDSL hydrolase family protein [Luteitalea pratensis]
MRRRAFGVRLVGGLIGCLGAGTPVGAQDTAAEPTWARNARAIHGSFTGPPGTLALFGDSITESLAFWAPLAEERKPAPPNIEAAFARVKARLRPECWSEWRGEAFGNASKTTVAWARQNVDRWLETLKPEVALIMFGSNDLPDRDQRGYRIALVAVAEACIKRGTVPIVSTVPPRSGLAAEAAAFSQNVRVVARELDVPLIDYHAEILARRPLDWDGTTAAAPGGDPYEVLTLISGDGVHPSNPARYFKDYSDEALRISGFGLRTAQALLVYDAVISVINAAGRLKQV